MKKIFAVILSIALVLSFTAVAFAAGGTPTEHTYKAYQIFEGRLDSNELKDIDWGSGIDGENFLAALQADTTFGDTFDDCETAADVAAILGGLTGGDAWTDNSDNAKLFARLAYLNKTGNGTTVANGDKSLDAGYYLVVDATDFEDPDETGTYRNLALLQMTGKGEFEINMKSSVPTLQKKVKDINDSTETELSGWQDSADYDIGDTIPFQITATIGQDISDFKTYELKFTDTGCAGLAVDDESFVIKVDGGDALTADDDYRVVIDGNNFTVDIYDVIAHGAGEGSVITIEYEAELTNDAEIGLPGNPNEVYLEYSSNPNYIDATLTPDETNEFGKTPEDKVIVFTYQLDVNKLEKIDDVDTPLKGAKFALFKQVGEEWVKVGEDIENLDGNEFEWVGIDDGNYKLVELEAPKGYAKMDDLLFTVTAEHDIESNEPTLTDLTGGDVFSGAVDTGAITGDVYNNRKGAILPETGGIGTKIFYGAGSVLVAGAAILLITKKRMKSEVAE